MGKFGNAIDAVKAFLSLVANFLKGAATYLDIAEVAIAWARVRIPDVVSFIENLVKRKDEAIAGLPPSLTEEELKIKKELAFQDVGDKAEAYFSASPSHTPRGILDGLIKYIVYRDHHKEVGDERNDIATKYGVLQSLDQEDTKEIIEQGLNKGFTGFGVK